MNIKLMRAIGPGLLSEYFQFLDELRESGETNMFGAGAYLIEEYPHMSKSEAREIAICWMKTFSRTLPPEDRVDNLLEKENE